jgi:hypothetical protein
MTTSEQEKAGGPSLPDYLTLYLQQIKPDTRGSSEAVEIQTYLTMRAQIDREATADIKQFMEGMLAEVCKEAAMLLSHYYGANWHDRVRERKALHKKVQPMVLYIALEDIMARQTDSSTYTQNPTRGRKNLFLAGNFSPPKEVPYVSADTPPPLLLGSFYKFGSHHFHVGHAINGILEHLEERYGLDFKKLELARQEAQKGPR